MIDLTKQAIKETLGKLFVTLQKLEIIVIEIEAMLNERPLTYISPNLSDPEPLTPPICCLEEEFVKYLIL